MDLTAQYAAAVYPDRWRVCGRLLLPLSIGHALWLHRVGSPFADFKTALAAGLGDLVLASWICSRPAGSARLGQPSTARRLAWAGWLWSRHDWFTQRTRFCGYLARSWAGPRVWIKPQDSGAATGVGILQMLKLHRMARLGQSEAEALATSVQVALWDMSAWAAERGLLEWVKPGEIEAMEGDATSPGSAAMAHGAPPPDDANQSPSIQRQERGEEQPSKPSDAAHYDGDQKHQGAVNHDAADAHNSVRIPTS